MSLYVRCRNGLKKIMERASKPEVRDYDDLNKEATWSEFAAVTILFFGILLEHEEKRVKKALPKVGQLLKETKNELWDMYNRAQNKKNVQNLMYILKQEYDISPGALLVTQQKMTFKSHPDYHRDDNEKKEISLPEGNIVLFLGVETDQKYDTLALKVLATNKILFYHKRESLGWFVRNFNKYFSLAMKANDDK